MTAAPVILCIDDQLTNVEIRAMLLRQFGCEVVVKAEPDAGLAELDGHAFDVVLVDYHLSEKRKGDEVAREIRRRKPKVKIVILTGDAKIPDDARSAADAVLIKGASGPADLWETLRELLPEEKTLIPRKPPLVFPMRSKAS